MPRRRRTRRRDRSLGAPPTAGSPALYLPVTSPIAQLAALQASRGLGGGHMGRLMTTTRPQPWVLQRCSVMGMPDESGNWHDVLHMLAETCVYYRPERTRKCERSICAVFVDGLFRQEQNKIGININLFDQTPAPSNYSKQRSTACSE